MIFAHVNNPPTCRTTKTFGSPTSSEEKKDFEIHCQSQWRYTAALAERRRGRGGGWGWGVGGGGGDVSVLCTTRMLFSVIYHPNVVQCYLPPECCSVLFTTRMLFSVIYHPNVVQCYVELDIWATLFK